MKKLKTATDLFSFLHHATAAIWMQEIEAPASAEPRDCHIEEIKGEVAADGACMATAKMAAGFSSNICRSKKSRRAGKQMIGEQIWWA